MDNLWYNIKNANTKKRQTLKSISYGFVLFIILSFVSKKFGGSLCPINRLLGIKCPGCGLTRAFMCILKLDIFGALKYNLMSLPLFICIVVYCILTIYDICFQATVTEKIEKILSKKYMYPLYLLAPLFFCVINNAT